MALSALSEQDVIRILHNEISKVVETIDKDQEQQHKLLQEQFDERFEIIESKLDDIVDALQVAFPQLKK